MIACASDKLETYYMACFQLMVNQLFAAPAMLNTRDVNQNAFTAFSNGVSVLSNVNCIVVAVTAEKIVATVLMFNSFWLACFCAMRIVGIPILAKADRV